MSEEQLKASQVEIKADTQAEVSDEELESAAGGADGGDPIYGGIGNDDLSENSHYSLPC